MVKLRPKIENVRGFQRLKQSVPQRWLSATENRLEERSLPFFKTLKKCTKKSDFQWTTEAEMAFKGMKQLIAELPMLTAPKEKRGVDYVSGSCKRSHQHSLDDKKGRETTDFIVEHPEDDTPNTSMKYREELLDPWILFTDGCSGAGLIITNPEGMEFTYALRFRFNATNNEAEYEALIAGLRIARKIGRREQKADALSKIASTSFAHLSKQVLVEELGEKSIDEKEILAVVEEEGHTWMTPVYEYLTEGIFPKEKKKERDANYVLREIHEGSCSMHAGPRSVVAKALRSGYYWPTMHIDARNLIRKCNDCQVHRPVARNSQEKLTRITSPWPFYKLGIDIARPFPEGPGKSRITNPRESAWISLRKRESKLQYMKQGAKPKWKDITTPGSETQASVQESLSIGTTKQATRKTGARSDLSGRDHTKSRKHWAKERTCLETAMDTPFREHGISATLKSVICMKCKHPLHVKQIGKEGTDIILFICNIFKFSVYFILSKIA
nr:hypothetical protein [Tanacetum cinerariifolium]